MISRLPDLGDNILSALSQAAAADDHPPGLEVSEGGVDYYQQIEYIPIADRVSKRTRTSRGRRKRKRKKKKRPKSKRKRGL